MGVSQILGAIVAIMIVIAIGIGVIHFETRATINQSVIAVAEQTASQYEEFAQALNSYVNANFNNNIIIGTVSCATLQQDNYLSSSFSCTDPLGETLQGDISEPWGFPQSWIVYPSTAPNVSELEKYGIDTKLQWKAFTYLVAQDIEEENSSMKAFSINNGMFTQLESNVSDNISDYFPNSNVEFTQTEPNISYFNSYSFFASPNLQKNPSYWLFTVSTFLASDTANIDYKNLGYSSICPIDGIIPGQLPTSDDFMLGQIYENFTSNLYSENSSVYNQSNFVGIYNAPYNYVSSFSYLCIPAPKNIINNSSSIFTNSNYSGSDNYYSNQIATNGGAYNGSSNSEINEAGNHIPQNYQVYFINIGMSKYIFIAAIGFVEAYNGPGSDFIIWPYYEGLDFWYGEPAYNNIGIESSIAVNSDGVYPDAPIWPVTDMQTSPIIINLG